MRQTRVYAGLMLFVAVSTAVLAQARSTRETIESIVARSEGSIDLGIACLVLAQDANPALDVERFDRALDSMVHRLRYLNEGRTDPVARIGLLNTYLYRTGWWNDSIAFTYDLEDLEASRLENQFLDGCLATKRGSCVTMSMLYLVLADRLGWPIKPVRGAKHIFCRYVDRALKENNIEATCGGGYIPDSEYVSQAGIPRAGVKHGVYLRTLSKKEYIASLLQNNVRVWQERYHDLEKAAYYCQLSIAWDSTLSSAYWNLGQLLREMAIRQDSLRYEEIERLKMEAPGKGARQRTPAIGNRKESPPSSLYGEVGEVDATYGSQIKALLERSNQLKRKANRLGIVLNLPTEFFRKQAESVELFKSTGQY